MGDVHPKHGTFSPAASKSLRVCVGTEERWAGPQGWQGCGGLGRQSCSDTYGRSDNSCPRQTLLRAATRLPLWRFGGGGPVGTLLALNILELLYL